MKDNTKINDRSIIKKIMAGAITCVFCVITASPLWGPFLYTYLNRDYIEERSKEQERLALEREEKRKDLCSLVEQVLIKAQYEDKQIGLSQKDMSALLENLGYQKDIISRLHPDTFSLYVSGKDFFHRNDPVIFVKFLYENGKFFTCPLTGEKEVDRWNLLREDTLVDEQELRDYLHKSASR